MTEPLLRPSLQDDPALREAQRERLSKVWAEPTGWRYFSSVNNDIVGKWYTLGAFFFFAFAGVLALLMRTQLMFPDNDFLSMQFYNQAFTMHGTMMMFLFAVPVFEAISIMLLPELLGNRDLPFPRLSAFGFWCFIIGGVFVTGSIFFGAAPTGGWFMYTPLSSEPELMGIGADIWLLGLSFIEIASIAAAVELIVGVLKARPPGMRLNLMPLYCWYVLVVAGMILFAFPPLIAGDLLLEVERAFDWPFFDPDRGGDPLLWQHLFWIFGHPEVYIVFLPSIAIVATIVPTFARVPMVGHSWIVLSAVGTAFISFGLWVHHMYTTGLPNISLGFFSAASEAVAIPTGVQIFAFIATLLVGRVTYSVPMLYATGALAIFVFGGLTGVMVAMVPFDWQAHDSYFIVAHLHYTLIGGVLFPLLAGIIYWYPFMTGKRLSDRLGRWAFWLMFGGFNIAFLPMHLTGALGMPRRVWTYQEGLGWDTLNLVSTLGAYAIGAGFAIFAYDVLRPKGKEPYVPRNIWNAPTMEYSQEVPAKHWGARCVPVITSRYPLWDQENFLQDYDEGRFYLADAEEGKRETMVTSVLDADPMQVLRVPGPSYKPMGAALGIGLLFILGTFGLYSARARLRPRRRRGDPLVALDRHLAGPREGDEARRPRRPVAALPFRVGFRRLVGNVHHHVGGPDRVPRPRLRVLLLLDDPSRVPAAWRRHPAVLACRARDRARDLRLGRGLAGAEAAPRRIGRGGADRPADGRRSGGGRGRGFRRLRLARWPGRHQPRLRRHLLDHDRLARGALRPRHRHAALLPCRQLRRQDDAAP